MQFSRSTIRRFIRLLLSIQAPRVLLHQTLTFSPQIREPKKAKAKLRKLLKSLGERFPEMAAVYMMQEHANEALHFHVLLFFFSPPVLPFPQSRMRRELSKTIFRIWSRLQDGRLARQANVMTERAKLDVYYLLKDVAIAESSKRGAANWYGRWNAKILRAHSCQVDVKKAKQLLDVCADRAENLKLLASAPKPKESVPYFGRAELLRLKKSVEAWEKAYQIEDWESFKCRMTKRNCKVSDADFIAFKNGEADWEQ